MVLLPFVARNAISNAIGNAKFAAAHMKHISEPQIMGSSVFAKDVLVSLLAILARASIAAANTHKLTPIT
jgi:hypothetical protein